MRRGEKRASSEHQCCGAGVGAVTGCQGSQGRLLRSSRGVEGGGEGSPAVVVEVVDSGGCQRGGGGGAVRVVVVLEVADPGLV